jgi:hypothetical protein
MGPAPTFQVGVSQYAALVLVLSTFHHRRCLSLSLLSLFGVYTSCSMLGQVCAALQVYCQVMMPPVLPADCKEASPSEGFDNDYRRIAG